MTDLKSGQSLGRSRKPYKQTLYKDLKSTFDKKFFDAFNLGYSLFNTYSMKSYCIIYFEHRNDVTSIVKFCLENTSRRRVFSVKLDYAYDVISMLKINYTIAFHGISVL